MRGLIFVCLILSACSTNAPPPAKEQPRRKISNQQAPDSFRVNFDTSRGAFVVEVARAWAPRGADRFYNLVESGFYDGARFFRVVPTFVIQFGISGDPSINRLWANMNIPDDPVKEHNRRGTVTFATSGKDTRTTQIFINMRDNSSLDKQGFAPFGSVTSGMDDVVAHLYFGYGDMSPRGSGPDPTQIELRGNAYLDEKYPRLDHINKATVEK